MKILIALPCMDTVPTQFMSCLDEMRDNYNFSLAMKAFEKCDKNMEKFRAIMLSSYLTSRKSPTSLIYDARNRLGQRCSEEGAEYILWLDSDMTFEPDVLGRMFESIGDKDFLTGLYFNRRPPYKPTIFKTANYEKDGDMLIPIADHYFDYPKDRIFEIAACGFGAVLMKTEMFVNIFNEKGLPFSPIMGFGEDISFCIRAKEMGYHLWCDPRIQFGHISQLIVTEQVSEAWRATHAE